MQTEKAKKIAGKLKTGLAIVGVLSLCMFFLIVGSLPNDTNNKTTIEDLAVSEEDFGSAVNSESMFVYNGYTGMETSNFSKAYQAVHQLVFDYKAEVTSESRSRNSFRDDGRYENATLYIEMESEKFNAFSDALERVGGVTIVDKVIDGSDESNDYISLDARMALTQDSLRMLEDLYNKASDIETRFDMMQQIIEMKKDMAHYQELLLKYDNDVKYSRMVVKIQEVSPLAFASAGSSYGEKIVTAFTSGWDLAVASFSALVLFILRFWVFWLVLVAFCCVLRIQYVKKQKRKQNPEQEVPNK